MYSDDELESILIRAIGSHQSLDMKKHLIEAVTKVFVKLEAYEDLALEHNSAVYLKHKEDEIMENHGENLHTIRYFDREEGEELIQFSLDYHSKRKKFYMNVHDGKSFTNIELSKDEMKIMLSALGEALSR